MTPQEVEELPWVEDPITSWNKVQDFALGDAPLDQRRSVLLKASIVSRQKRQELSSLTNS